MGDRRRRRRNNSEVLRFLQENKKILIGIAAAAVVLIAVLVGTLVGSSARKSSGDGAAETETAEKSGTESQESTAESTSVALEENAYPQIISLIEAYYQAATDGDVEALQSLTQAMSEDMLIYLQKRSAYIEEYRDLTCYTKAGPVEDSFVVYASYDVKFQGVDTLVPGISPFLVFSKGDGSYYIYEGEVEEAVNAYLEEVSAQDDVVDLMNLVQVKFNEAVTADEDLSDFLAKMTDDLKVEVGEALADAQTAQKETESEADAQQTIRADEVRAIDVVNVRASDSEQAERIGKLQIGDVLSVIESRANGWTKVDYNGKEGFVKSEFLEPVGGQQEEAGDAEEDAGAVSTLPASGTVTVAETVNVRESPDEKADRLGVCYQGAKLEILAQQSDGWTKVKFEGKTGYVKTEVLKILN